MRLYVNRRYSSHVGSYKAGDIIEVDEKLGAWLMRDGEGIFEPITESEAGAESLPTSASGVGSEETATGLVAPDRRARGGRVRTKK